MSPLHPNLARIAAEYDQIVSSYQQGQIAAHQAAAKIAALAAKDDAGVEWSIDPVSGTWRYRTIDGRFLEAEPPAWGLSAATPQDLGTRGRPDQDVRITFHEVDESKFRGSLHGSTRRDDQTNMDASSPHSPRALLVGLVIAGLFAVICTAAFNLL